MKVIAKKTHYGCIDPVVPLLPSLRSTDGVNHANASRHVEIPPFPEVEVRDIDSEAWA